MEINIKSEQSEELSIPDKLSVHTDQRTQAKSIGLPFIFPDGTTAMVMITKITKDGWIPKNDIEKITIKFKPREITKNTA